MGDITEIVVWRSGDFQIINIIAAHGTIANIQCGPHKPKSLTPLLYCTYYSMLVAGLIYCMCTTSVYLLMFYDLSKCTEKLGCIFTKCICSKCKYIPEKIPISQAVKSANYIKTTDTMKKLRSFLGSAHQKTYSNIKKSK